MTLREMAEEAGRETNPKWRTDERGHVEAVADAVERVAKAFAEKALIAYYRNGPDLWCSPIQTQRNAAIASAERDL